MSLASLVLVLGYLFAVPFSVWPPGLRRLWRRREPWVIACEEVGVVLIVIGWSVKGQLGAVLVNAMWGLGLAVAYGLAGRRRPPQTSSPTSSVDDAAAPGAATRRLPLDRHPS